MSSWVTVQPSLDPVLEPVNAVLATIDGVLSALLAILNIVQTILNIIKAFLLGLLDPLKAIIKAIIQEIRNIINDLRQMGLYLHAGDIDLCSISNNFRDVRGGFQAFERRCVSRLLDRTDFTRPNFSPSSAALCGFFYVSGQDVDALVRVILAIINFISGKNKKAQGAFPQPTSLSVTYGNQPLSSFKELGAALSPKDGVGIPNKAVVSWQMPAGPGPGGGFKIPAPKGWIVELSTIDGGLRVVGKAPDDRNSSSLYPSEISSVAIDPVTNGILSVYGGSDMVGSNVAGSYSDVWPPNPQDPRAVKLFFQKDTITPLIPPVALSEKNGGPWLGAAYFVPNGITGAMPGQTFTAVFDASMLPKDADIEQDATNEYGIKLTERTPSSFFVRVRPVGKSIAQGVLDGQGSQTNPHPLTGESLRLYKFGADNIRKAQNGKLLPSEPMTGVSVSDWGVASAPLEMSFPSESSQKYIEAIQLAIITLFLARSDALLKDGAAPMEVWDESSGQWSKPRYIPGAVYGQTGLEEVSRKLFPLLKVDAKFFSKTGSAVDWRKRVRSKALAFANDLYRMASLSETLMANVVEMAEPLFNTTWRDMANAGSVTFEGGQMSAPDLTIAQTFGLGSEDSSFGTPKESLVLSTVGACQNMNALPLQNPDYSAPQYFQAIGGPSRSPGFGQKGTKWAMGRGSLDNGAPIIYELEEDLDYAAIGYAAYARNLLLAKPEVLTAASSVLRVTAAVRSPQDGSWMVYRPLYEMLAPLDAILTNVENWLMAILEALEGIIDRIIAYIEAIQARIYQLQALIEWIRSLLRSLDFALPSVSGLVTVSNGTDGILMDLMAAENKPQDDPQSIGVGVIMIAGGMPNLLLDLFAAIMGGGDSGGDVDA